MTVSGANSLHSSSLSASLRSAQTNISSFNTASFGPNHSGASHTHLATGLDRYRTSPAPTQRSLTPVQQGEAARAADAATTTAKATGAAAGAAATPEPPQPIRVGSTVVTRADGVRVTTVYLDVKANFRVDGGTLPTGQTATTQARTIERAIERDFTKTYRNPDGSITRYITNVNMTVGKADSAERTQLVYVAEGDSRIGGALGIAPGFEKGNTAFIGDHAGARTAPHEFGHLLGLRHTAQVNQGCTTAPGIKVDNLMSQTGCSPTSQQIERSQLQQIFKTPEFR
jgi:hypothetical protein